MPAPVQPHGAEVEARHDRRRRRRVVASSLILGGAALIAVLVLFLLIPPQEDGGVIEVISVPEGAQVDLNGGSLSGTTPLVIPVKDLEREYSVVVKRTNFQNWSRKVTLSEDDPRVRILAVLTPIYGHLTVKSTPSGADVYVNGEHKGTTPSTIEDLLPTEDVNLELRLRGYKPATRTLSWEGQTYLNAEITLQPSR
jgi:hypothetical protein